MPTKCMHCVKLNYFFPGITNPEHDLHTQENMSVFLPAKKLEHVSTKLGLLMVSKCALKKLDSAAEADFEF